MKNNFIVLIFFSFILPASLFAQNWDVPADKKDVVCSFKFDANSQKQGEVLYKKYCIPCHGEPDKSNFAKLTPAPGDMATDKFSKLKDGEFFYKMSNGKGQMPRFLAILKEIERWQIISYVRTFHKGYVQKFGISEKDKNKKQLFLSLIKGDGDIFTVKSRTLNEKDTIDFPGVEVKILAKRYFGFLTICESKTTDKSGIAKFEINSTIPADTSGKITFYVRPVNQEFYGDAESQITIKYGVKNTKEPLNKKRAIWNTLEKAPIWIISTYLIGVILVWSFIIYIVLQLLKIKK